MYQYTLDPEEELQLSRPSSAQVSQAAAKQVAPSADNTDFLQQAMQVLGDKRAQQQPVAVRRVPSAGPSPDTQGDDWRMLLAMGLDILGNNGRNLGQIALGATQMRNQRIDAYNAQNSPEAQLNRELQVAQLRNADAQQGRAETQEAAQLANQLRQDYQAKEGTREFNATQAQRQSMHDDQMLYQGLSAQDRKTKMALDAGVAQQQLAQGQQRIGLGYGQLHLGQQQLESLNDYRAQQLAADQAQRENQLEIAKLKRPGVGGSIPGTIVTDQGAANMVMNSPALLNKAVGEVQNARLIQQSLNTLQKLYNAPESDANRKTWNTTIKTLIGDRSKEGSTGVLSNPEFIRYVEDLADYSSRQSAFNKWRQLKGGGLFAAQDLMRGEDPTQNLLDQLQQQAAQKSDVALSVYGHRLDPEWQIPGIQASAQHDDLTGLGIPGLELEQD